MFILECSQSHRNKRAVTVQSQQITLTTVNAEKIDIQRIAETMKSKLFSTLISKYYFIFHYIFEQSFFSYFVYIHA